MTTKIAKPIAVRVWGVVPSGSDKECPHRKDCANHATAGDFRTEGGDSPDLVETDSGWQCSQQPTQTGSGAILTDGAHVHDRLRPGRFALANSLCTVNSLRGPV